MFDTVNEIKQSALPKKRRQRAYLSVRLQNSVDTPTLYDTGADISAIKEEVFDRIPAEMLPEEVPMKPTDRFYAAGGQRLHPRGRFNICMMVEGREVTYPFYVIKDLNEPMIMGDDCICDLGLQRDVVTKEFFWHDEGYWCQGQLKVSSIQTLDPLSVTMCKLKVKTKEGFRPKENDEVMINVCHKEAPLIFGGPYLAKIDSEGQVTVPVYNCAPTERRLERNEFIGVVENANKLEKREINPRYLNAVQKQLDEKEALSDEKRKFILENLKLNVPEEFKEAYTRVILDNHSCISRHRFDLGRTDTLMHEIALKTEEPIYVKQFRIPDAHREEVEKHVNEWLKMGVVQSTRSKYNSPIFAVSKKNGGIRLVQDFRALNAATHVDKYSMKDVSECIGEIGRSGSTLFTTIDLTGGFWQMLLQPRSRPYTAFTVPGKGQFQWVTSPMGLLGCPSSFQRLMETVVHGIENVIVYIDDLLVHSSTHEQHLRLLDQLLKRLVQHNVKLNLQKCEFGSRNVAYLGFRLTEEGVKPGVDKLKAVEKALPPTDVHEIRQFLGLCNFFRTHVRNFAQLSAPLTALTRKDAKWTNGVLPPDALKSFRELQSYLCSEPIVAYPRRDRPYALITDASLGGDGKPGGLGAILTQVDVKGDHHVIAYASRKLQKHEANYTPFLLEMQAALWGMDHYDTYLRGRPFILYTDHRPLEKLGKVHTKTLNRLQEAMGRYNFEIIYKKGSEMPADYLSRNVVNAISWDNDELAKAQEGDPCIRALRDFLLNKQLPRDETCQRVVKHFADDCFVEDGLVWKRVKRKYEPSRVVIFLPESLIEDALKDAHGHLLTGHDGIFKTKERLFQCFYWPGMDQDISEHLQKCHRCQIRRKDDRPTPVLVTTMPQPTEPNQRVHADLFGPLRTSGNQKKFVLCITDAFTKCVELVALPSKESNVVAQAIFEKWFCRYGIPLEVFTDQGKEFCGSLSEDLFRLMQVQHTTTSAYHPQCNAQAEVANKTIAKYLASFVDDSTLDWEPYLAPLMFVYNTSFHRSIKTSPFFLTYGMEARQPNLPGPDLRRKFYGESTTDELLLRLLTARDVARRNNETTSSKTQADANRSTEAHTFKVGQLVLLDEHSFLHKNVKLAPNWSGPHTVLRLKNDNTVELKLKNGRVLITHASRLKPYFVPTPVTADFVEHQLVKKSEPTEGEQISVDEKMQMEAVPHDPWVHRLPPVPMAPREGVEIATGSVPGIGAVPPAQEFQDVRELLDDAGAVFRGFTTPPPTPTKPSTPIKRGRGRPRKVPLPTIAEAEVPPRRIPSGVAADVVDVAVASPEINIQGQVQVGEAQIEAIKDENNDSDGWVTVVRKRRRAEQWSKAKRGNFLREGDVYILSDPGEVPPVQNVPPIVPVVPNLPPAAAVPIIVAPAAPAGPGHPLPPPVVQGVGPDLQGQAAGGVQGDGVGAAHAHHYYDLPPIEEERDSEEELLGAAAAAKVEPKSESNSDEYEDVDSDASDSKPPRQAQEASGSPRVAAVPSASPRVSPFSKKELDLLNRLAGRSPPATRAKTRSSGQTIDPSILGTYFSGSRRRKK